jgi:hypothetical protein
MPLFSLGFVPMNAGALARINVARRLAKDNGSESVATESF